jgi:hypothetical protein
MSNVSKTTLKLAGEYYTIIRDSGGYYLYTSASADDHNEMKPFSSKQRAIKRAEGLAQIRREANTARLQAEIDAIRAALAEVTA